MFSSAGPSRAPCRAEDRSTPYLVRGSGQPRAGMRRWEFRWKEPAPALFGLSTARPPAAPGEGGPAGREPRSPCREGSGAPRLPAGLRPGAGPAHRLGFLLWPVCVCVTEGREMGRRRRARQRERARETGARDTETRELETYGRDTEARDRARHKRETVREGETAMDRMTDKRQDKTEKR